jgi:hypothetical protein
MKMRHFFIFFWFAAFAACGVTITNDMREINGAAYNAAITITPLTYWNSNDTYIVNGPARTYTPSTGIVTMTNIQQGLYSVKQASHVMYIAAPSGTGTYNLAQLSTNGLTIYSGTLGSGYPGNVKVTSTDTTPNVLGAKIVAGSNITITTNNPTGNATLTITGAAVGSGISAATATNMQGMRNATNMH